MLTKMDEKRQLKAMREGLFEAFPNSERKGCPGPEVMRAIVAGRMPRSEEDQWIDHFVLCSPCSKEFFEIRRGDLRKKRVRRASIVSAVVLVVVLGLWGWVRHQESVNSKVRTVQVAVVSSFRQQVVDLRNWSGERTDGRTESGQNKPLELHRWHTSLVIYLPLGSEPGKYEVRIAGDKGPAVDVSGIARIENGNTVFRAKVNLSQLQPGQYSLGVRQPPGDWRYHSLTLQ